MEESLGSQSQSQNINNELAKICKWLKANKFSLNVKKTKFMIFHMPQKKIESPVLQIDGANIACVNGYNFFRYHHKYPLKLGEPHKQNS